MAGSAVVPFHALRDGRVDAIAMWFTLHLDEETCLDTSPNVEDAWGQV
jgi:hypothetical protein